VTIHTRRWEPDGPIKAVVGLVHGLGEHSGRYGDLAARLTDAGYAVEAFDLRGHGASGGRRGDTRFGETFGDVDRLLAGAAERFPRFLYGHSLGGLLVLSYTLSRRPPLAGVIASGPALHNALRDQTAKVLAVRLLAPLFPHLALPAGIDDTLISRDPAVVAAYRADALRHDRATLGFGRDALGAADTALAAAAMFPVPLLLLHGGADRLTYPTGSRTFAAALAPERCTLTVYEGLFHEVHHEPEQDRVLDDVVAWLDGRLDNTTHLWEALDENCNTLTEIRETADGDYRIRLGSMFPARVKANEIRLTRDQFGMLGHVFSSAAEHFFGPCDLHDTEPEEFWR
jgi:alpha-beta hydrolase superfamily lysophospholipase